jgi:hypothetical protein
MFSKVLFTVLILLFLSAPALAAENDDNGGDDIFTGDKRLACEAILCLSTPTRPSECDPSIRAFYSIKRYTSKGSFSASKTRNARKQFLALCPTGDNATVNNLAGIFSYALNQCDVEYLNSRKVYYARAFDVLRAVWSGWQTLGRNNEDIGTSKYRFNSYEFPACSNRQLNYAANLAARKEIGPDPETGAYPVRLTCYETRSEIDSVPPDGCVAIYESSDTDYRGLEYVNGKWVR